MKDDAVHGLLAQLSCYFREGHTFVQRGIFRAAFVVIRDLEVLQAEEPQDGGMEIMHVQTVLHRVQSEVVGGTDGLSTLNAAAGHPHRKAGGIVVSSVALFAHGGATELAAPNHEGFFEQATGVKVFEQASDRQIGFSKELGVIAFDFGVCVPFATGAAVELDKADAALDEAAGEEAHRAKLAGFRAVEAVECFGGAGFGLGVERVGCFHLHAGGEFVGVDACFEICIETGGRVFAVHRIEHSEFRKFLWLRDI